MAKKPIKITEVALRDAHQSLIATRMTMDEMRPILPAMDEVGYYSVECWGGATFDSCIRFLDEDPWDRLRILRKEMPNTKLQMLFRGQNMLGYRHYADDAVEYFVQKSVANGIDILRIFDALNDPRNLETAIKAAIKEKAHVQGCISYTLSPVHNNEYFAKYAKTLEEMGAHSICIKDMAGLLTPYSTYELVKSLKETVSIPVDIHSHYTSGLASMSILKGIEAGADIIDTAISPLSLGTSHMPTESLVAALQGTDYDTGLDLKKLNVVREHFAKLREKYLASGQLSPKMLGVDANTPAVSGAGRYAVQPAQAAEGRGQGGPARRRAAGDSPRAQGLRLSAARYPDEPDRRHPGGVQRHSGRALQDGNEGVQRPCSRRLRQDACSHQPRVHKADPRRRAAHHLPSGRSAGAGDREAEGGSQQVCHAGGGRAHVRHVPAGRAQVL